MTTQHEYGIKALMQKKTVDIIKLIDSKQFNPEKLIKNINLKQGVSAELQLMPLKWVLDKYKSFFIDHETLQRFLQEWKKAKVNSYLSTVFGGLSHKDLFQLADINKIVEEYNHRLSDETLSKQEKMALQDSYNYFKNLQDSEYTYLILDGQHRLKYLYDFLNNEITFDVLNEFTPSEIKIDGLDKSYSVSMSGKKFNELAPPIQIHLLYNVTIPVTFFYSGSVKVLAFTFVASNDGNPMSYHEKRSVLCKNKFVRFLVNYSLQHAERKTFWKRIAKVNLDKKEDTLFHALMFPWYLMQRSNCNVNVSNNYNFSLFDSDFQFEEMFNVDKNYLEGYKKVFDEVLKVIVLGKPKIKLKYAELFDLFYIVHLLTDKGFNDYTYKIEDYTEFLVWFTTSQKLRKARDRFVLNADGTDYKDHNGKSVEKKHSFASKLKEQNASNFIFRINEIKKDIENEIDTLVMNNLIKAIGNRKSSMTVADVAEQSNYVDAIGAKIPKKFVYTDHGTNYEINEKNNVANGGKRVKENVDLTTSIHNKQKYNIEQKNK